MSLLKSDRPIFIFGEVSPFFSSLPIFTYKVHFFQGKKFENPRIQSLKDSPQQVDSNKIKCAAHYLTRLAGPRLAGPLAVDLRATARGSTIQCAKKVTVQ